MPTASDNGRLAFYAAEFHINIAVDGRRIPQASHVEENCFLAQRSQTI